jgi:hypothetical protein
MEKLIHKASDRGIADHGWLKTAHSFSFADYYNPEKPEKRDAAVFWPVSEPLKIAMSENPKLLAIEVSMQ